MALIGLSFENELVFLDSYLPKNPAKTLHIKDSFSFISNFSEVKSNNSFPYFDALPFEDVFVIYYPRPFSLKQVLTFEHRFVIPIVVPFTDVVFFDEVFNKLHIDQVLIFSDSFTMINATTMEDIFFFWDYFTIAQTRKKLTDILVLKDSFVGLNVNKGAC